MVLILKRNDPRCGNQFAKKLAYTFANECLGNGMVPYWDCMEVNAPSIAVAESIGFQQQFKYKVYEFPFD
ncbi:GNAT family N-acetyltransferase [Alkalihalobacterium elongatum]|uniref:GNAT family N-acetyltransferase n=1 Tax=Alkalihalobacterium elongatum TaxID=2675466 RepID=UPI001C1F3119|nr:GNAT family N-acetyltransferase [Alkalihalobacterium elongatum]